MCYFDLVAMVTKQRLDWLNTGITQCNTYGYTFSNINEKKRKQRRSSWADQLRPPVFKSFTRMEDINRYTCREYEFHRTYAASIICTVLLLLREIKFVFGIWLTLSLAYDFQLELLH